MRSVRAVLGACVAAMAAATFSGCVTGPFAFEDTESNFEPGSDSWWNEKASSPVGARQKHKRGKVWPPFPRPTGPKQQATHVFHAAHYWPYPYVCQDRQWLNQVWELQAAAGWAKETTLYGYHFDPATFEITVPGRKHLNWILYGAPPQYRNVYLHRSDDEIANQQRMASLMRAITELSPNGDVPVNWRVGESPSRPASQIQAMQAAEAASQPAPVLGSTIGGGAAGGGGGGAAPAATGAGGP